MKVHQCSNCGNKFGSFDLLKTHRALRTCRPKHQCVKCSSSFNDKNMLSIHEQEVHVNSRTCPFCSRTLQREEMVDHLKEEHRSSSMHPNEIKFMPSTSKFKSLSTFTAQIPVLLTEDSLKFVLFVTLKELFLNLSQHCFKFAIILSGIFSRSSGNLTNEIVIIPIRHRGLYFFPLKTTQMFEKQIGFLVEETRKRLQTLHHLPGSNHLFHGFERITVEVTDIPTLMSVPLRKTQKRSPKKIKKL